MSENMGIVLSSIVGGSYEGKFKAVSPELSLNMYPEPNQGSNGGSVLKSIDGNEAVLYFGENTASKTELNEDFGIGCRGIYASTTGPNGASRLFAVYDKNLWVVDNTLEPTGAVKCGSIGSMMQPVRFAESGGINPQLCMATGNYTTAVAGVKDNSPSVTVYTNPINPYGDGNPARSTHIVEMHNRVLINDADNGQIFISRVGAFQGGTIKVYDLDSDGNIQYESNGYTPIYKDVDGNAWAWKDDLGNYMYYTPMSDTGDRVLAMECLNNGTLFVFGNHSYAVLTMEDSEYQLKNTLMGNNIGILAPQSLAKIGDRLYWVGAGDDGHNGVYEIGLDSKPKKVSTFALDYEMQQVGDVSNAFAFGYSYAGHHFYVLTVPEINKTFVYDLDTGLWHNRSTRSEDNEDLYWFPVFAKQFNGDVYFGNYEYNVLMRMSPDTHTEWDGRPIRRLRRTPIIFSDLAPFIVNEFRLECNVGCTEEDNPSEDMENWNPGDVEDNPAYDPKIILRFSPDAGNTWDECDVASLGRIGEYEWECKYLGLGMARKGCIEVSMTAPVDFVITDSKIRYTKTRGF